LLLGTTVSPSESSSKRFLRFFGAPGTGAFDLAAFSPKASVGMMLNAHRNKKLTLQGMVRRDKRALHVALKHHPGNPRISPKYKSHVHSTLLEQPHV
jgi:hypothetical protein